MMAMVQKFRPAALLVGVFLACGGAARAGTLVEYALERTPQGPSEHRQAWISNGRLYIKAVNGSESGDVLFDRNRQIVWYIDHGQRQYYEVSEQKLQQLTQQGRALLSAAESLAQQFNLQLPEQFRSTAPGAPVRYFDRGDANVNGVACRRFDIVDGDRKSGTVCLSTLDALNISADDYETLLSLRQFVQRVNVQAADVVAPLGVKLPQLGNADMPGIPVELQTDAVDDLHRVYLSKAEPAGPTAQAMAIPQGYAAAALPLPGLQ